MKSKGSRHHTREEVMKRLFKLSFHDHLTTEHLLEDLEEGLRESENSYLTRVISSYMDHAQEVDQAIEKSSTGWKFHRISKVDLAILRLATTELFYLEDIPTEVSVNEAMELSKEYSTEDAYSFINGVLGNIITERSWVAWASLS